MFKIKPRITEEEINKVIELKKQGLKNWEIANKAVLKISRVNRILMLNKDRLING